MFDGPERAVRKPAARLSGRASFMLRRSRLIEMNVRDEPAHPGALVSLPARVNGGSLRVRYVR